MFPCAPFLSPGHSPQAAVLSHVPCVMCGCCTWLWEAQTSVWLGPACSHAQ